MHRSFFSLLAALTFAVAIRADTDVALVATATTSSDPAPTAGEPRRLAERLATIDSILREFQSDPQLAIPAEVLREARAIVIVNQVKGGLIVGLQFGYGIVLARRPDETWSVPVFLRAGEASLGLQLGGKRTETIYVLMDDATVRLLFNSRMNIGVDARAVAGPRTYEVERMNRDILDTPVLVYGRNHGLYAGATV
ncbi:MAG: lipid-binding SYLF domain-containing protein, partial [Burkholderiales bacterium]|nr:lipid-binding SYLF domain-containing protein [Opitutaceae bacterium]